MPKETFTHKDGISLKDYFESRLSDINKATELANKNLEVRLDSLNEWRMQNKDERSLYMPRKEYQAYQKVLINDIEELKVAKARAEGKASMNAVYFGYALAIISLIISLLRWFFGG